MRLTIERMRTLVLVAGGLLIVALAVFLAIGRIKSPFNRRDLPKKLGINIQQEENGFTHAEFRAGKATFKITASKVEHLKDGHLRLHSVKVEMYSANGNGMDSIEGDEFEYDLKGGVASAAGPVDITIARPSDTLAVASTINPSKPIGVKPVTGPLAHAAEKAQAGQIHVKTSGLTFNQKTGIASTSQQVAFSMAQGSGSAVGATFDSQQGQLVLDRAVQLSTVRGSEPVNLQAQHAEFERGDQVCHLVGAAIQYKSGDARAQVATIQFREDGSAKQLNATSGFELSTATGGHLTAPIGSLEFDAHNQPTQGNLQGGVVIDSKQKGRAVHGSAPTALLEFASAGVLRRAHLERDVHFSSDEETGSGPTLSRMHRAWTSPFADLEFRNNGHGQVQLASIHGTGGVVVSSDSQRGQGSPAPSRLSADDVTALFGASSALTSITGVGHASIVETTPTGTLQTTTGDRLEAHFAGTSPAASGSRSDDHRKMTSAQISSANVAGHVVLVQQPAVKPGAPPQPPVRATADQAAYEGSGEWLHLIGNPRVEDGGLQLTADKIDVSQSSGDAFAHGNVKATWFGSENAHATGKSAGVAVTNQTQPSLGGQGPAHVIAAEAQLHQATGEATFRGQARLWQDANSIQAPLIVLNRTKQTLSARTMNPSEPVRIALLSSTRTTQGKRGTPESPSVIRIRGGDFKYSDAERKAVIHGAAAGSVIAETWEATIHSDDVELVLLSPGNHAGKDGSAAQLDHMTATGHVLIESQGRRGTGEQLAYSGESGDYVLTGTSANPPRLIDPAKGTVTGESLIFNSRDDSVDVEGGGHKTLTETTVPKKP